VTLKSDLLAGIAERYRPGEPVTPDVDEAVKAAAALLEEDAGAPDLAANGALLAGCWQLRFDSRDLLHASADMDRMSGGMLPKQSVAIHNTFQELRSPTQDAQGFYRNTMVMEQAGVGFLYISTASFTVDADTPNIFNVSFYGTSFVPLNAKGGASAVRQALNMPDHMPMDMTLPEPMGPFPALVTYCDESLRINRGADYISVLERIA
jgi:hypothetical protein